MPIPHWTEVPDYFEWDAFDMASQDPSRSLKPEASQQEALLAATDNFYVVPDQFGVVSGHMLVIPKAQSSSIAALDPVIDNEINWLLESLSEVVSDTYAAQPVLAEHGECGCTTAAQAHVHVLPLPRTVTATGLRTIVDEVLERRRVGIERVSYRGTDFTALEDIHELAHSEGAEVIGRQLQCSDFPDGGGYPTSARSESGLIQPYVYFSGPGIRLVSIRSFRSQFVREVVSTAAGLPSGTWDRRVHTSRTHMFDTFARIGPELWRSDHTAFGFEARAGAFS